MASNASREFPSVDDFGSDRSKKWRVMGVNGCWRAGQLTISYAAEGVVWKMSNRSEGVSLVASLGPSLEPQMRRMLWCA